MKRRWNNYLMLTMAFLAFLLIPGCSMESGVLEGSLVVQVQEAMTRNIFTSTNTLTGNDMNIEGYKITLISPGTDRGFDGMVYHRKADGSPIVLEALEPGLWGMEIAGYNGWNDNTNEVSGEQIAYLDQGSTTFSIQRGTITSKQAVLVPMRSDTGALDIVIDWAALNSVDEQKLYNNPDVSVKVTQINDRFSNYPTTNWNDASSKSVTTETKAGTLDAGGNSSTISFTELPVGWYEVVATLTSSSSQTSNVTQLKRMGYVRVIDDGASADAVKTTGTFTITDATSFATGSLDLSISEDMDPLSVSFTEMGSPEGINYPNTDGFGSEAYGSFEVEATGADEANTLSYAWYVNGELVSDQTAASMIYSFSEAGQYTVTAVVYEKNGETAVNWGSASHEVVVGSGLGTKELLNVTVAEDTESPGTYVATVTYDSNPVTGLTYVWYGDGGAFLEKTTSNTCTVSISQGLCVFAYELDNTTGNLTRWGSDTFEIGFN
ncbi:MAG: PKD domain-containing protein [Sphaerochaetaceae bacterium]|nr:PKD domain-containing protein [uncultured Sphaerochaeta sp.]MDC7230820.1 PKD domain-containing protein [Sphaerochaetaceae bacterium]